MKTIVIEVAQEDIAHATRSCGWRCPIALAVARATGLLIFADQREIEFWRQQQTLVGKVPTPPPVVAFIDAFDAEEEARPFTFALSVPAEVIVPDPDDAYVRLTPAGEAVLESLGGHP